MDVTAIKPTDGYTAAKSLPEKSTQIKPVTDETISNAAVNADKKQLSKDINRQELDDLSQELSKFMSAMSAGIQFTVHEKTNSLMVQVIDSKNQRVLKEFPSKEFLDTIANIREYVGFLLDKKA